MSDQSPFDVLEASLRLLCAGPSPLAVHGRELGPPFPRRPIPLTDLTGMLLHPATPFEARDRAMRVLVRRAQHQGGDWTVGLFGVILPGLRAALAPMVRAYPAGAEDLEAEALVGLVEVLASFDPATERVASRLLWRAAQRARRRLAREQAEAGRLEVVMAVHDPEQSSNHPDLLLKRAVEAKKLSPAEARLIGDTRVGDVSLTAWALAEGEPESRTRMRRMRAERKLVRWIFEEGCDESAFFASFVDAGRSSAVGQTGPGQLAQPGSGAHKEVSVHAHRPAPAAGAARPGLDSSDRRSA
jgi:hypothetical protein